MVLSKFLYAILGLCIAIVLYLIYQWDQVALNWTLLPLVILCVLTYIFSGEIDFWWRTRQKLSFDPVEESFIKAHLDYYNRLDETKKQAFANRTKYFLHQREFMLQNIPSLPDDIKLLICTQAIVLCDFLGVDEKEVFKNYEHIVLYAHPFITPSIDQVHASETHFEDGVFIFSLEQLLPGLLEPNKYFNIVLYEMCRVFMHNSGNKLNKLDEIDISHFLEEQSNFAIENVQKWLGVAEVSYEAMALMILIEKNL